MRVKIKIKDALLITISVILLWVSYFFIKDYEFHIENIGGHLSVTKTNLADKRYEKEAIDALYSHDYEKALELFKKQLKSDPQYPAGVYHNIGMTYVLMNKYNDAIEYLNKSIEIDKDYNATYYYLAEAYYYLNKMTKAKENYEKTVTLKDRAGNTNIIKKSYEKLGYIENISGNTQKAQEYFQKADEY